MPRTVHTKEGGRQRTYHVVTVTDATGESFSHTWEATGDGIEYRGAGEPGDIEPDGDAPASAVDALEAYIEEDSEDVDG